MGIALGTRLGAYEVVGAIGSGGMGEVYRAVHSKLGREVAIKVLPPELAADETGLARFEREARTASALNHPSIVTIYDIDEHDSTTFIAMELVEGRTLREILSNGPLPIDRALHIARQLADGLAKAHEAGIVHRDMKPANVMVTEDGLAKILDFGLAKPLAAAGARDAIAVTLTRSGESTIAGTPRYMSPEQWTGETVDHRSDQFAFGVLLYEMLAGEPPFDGPTLGAVMTATLTRPAPPVRRSRADAPAELERIIGRCVEKDPAHRFDSTAEVVAALRACEESRARAAYGLLARLRRPAVAVPLAAVALATVAAAGLWVRGREARWAEREAIGEVERGIEAGDLFGAFRTYMAAAEHRPDDPELERVLARFTIPGVVNTDPPGAEVCVKDYATPGGECLRLGTTPLSLRLPYALLRWRITRDGYEPVEGAPFSPVAIEAYARGLVLDTPGGRPPGMVRVPGGAVTFIQGVRDRSRAGEPLAILGTYFLDRYEVTNGQFQEFVDRGGYGEAEWWPAPIGGDGQEVDRKAMMARLVDRTGRPGPATWELGRPPEGEAEHPVGGLSWYEAAAYCAFAGKSLPTIFHWFHAVGQLQTSDILGHSNVGGTEVAPVGQYRGLAGFGTYDMAGNVREWAWNATGGQRYNVSSAWNEPGYAFRFPRSEDPWSRDPANGVRCVRYIDDVPEALLGPVTPQLEYDRPEPIDTRGFELVRAMYAYERSGLDPRLERVDDSLPDWRRETVSFRTAYGDGRMEAHLLIPRDVEPPYQSVIWFPGGDVYALRTSETLSSSYLVDFLPRTGRVLVQPVFYGMYERFEPPPWDSPTAMRDLVVRWAQDVGRTIDYLETRPDFDASRIAYYGFSNGALFAPIFGAIEPRLGAMILLGGGLVPYPFRPESHPATFAPRARTPALLINGRDDFIVPYEVGQRPLFEMLGAPADSKRHALLEGGHMSDRSAIIREVLAFLDARFGRVSGVAER